MLTDYEVETLTTANHTNDNYKQWYMYGDLGGYAVGSSFAVKHAVVTDIESWSMGFTLVDQDLSSGFVPVGFWSPPHWFVGQTVVTGEIGWLWWDGAVQCKVVSPMQCANGGPAIPTPMFWWSNCNGQVMLMGEIEVFEVKRISRGINT